MSVFWEEADTVRRPCDWQVVLKYYSGNQRMPRVTGNHHKLGRGKEGLPPYKSQDHKPSNFPPSVFFLPLLDFELVAYRTVRQSDLMFPSCFFFFKTGSGSIAQAGLQLSILLPPPEQCVPTPSFYALLFTALISVWNNCLFCLLVTLPRALGSLQGGLLSCLAPCGPSTWGNPSMSCGRTSECVMSEQIDGDSLWSQCLKDMNGKKGMGISQALLIFSIWLRREEK
jgi:hypothetical protein